MQVHESLLRRNHTVKSADDMKCNATLSTEITISKKQLVIWAFLLLHLTILLLTKTGPTLYNTATVVAGRLDPEMQTWKNNLKKNKNLRKMMRRITQNTDTKRHQESSGEHGNGNSTSYNSTLKRSTSIFFKQGENKTRGLTFHRAKFVKTIFSCKFLPPEIA